MEFSRGPEDRIPCNESPGGGEDRYHRDFAMMRATWETISAILPGSIPEETQKMLRTLLYVLWKSGYITGQKDASEGFDTPDKSPIAQNQAAPWPDINLGPGANP